MNRMTCSSLLECTSARFVRACFRISASDIAYRSQLTSLPRFSVQRSPQFRSPSAATPASLRLLGFLQDEFELLSDRELLLQKPTGIRVHLPGFHETKAQIVMRKPLKGMAVGCLHLTSVVAPFVDTCCVLPIQAENAFVTASASHIASYCNASFPIDKDLPWHVVGVELHSSLRN